MKKRDKIIAIVILLAGLSAISVIISAYFIRDRVSESLIEEELKTNLALAEQASGFLEKEIHTIQDKVGLITKLSQIQESNSQVCSQKLAEVTPYIKEQIDNITRFNSKLTLDCAINQKSIGYVLGPESEITAVIKDPKHSANLSRSGYSPITDQYVLYLTLPVFSRNEDYYGIIGGVLYLNYFADKYLKNINLGKGGYVTLLDDDGTFLYYPDKRYIGKNIDSPEVKDLSAGNSILKNLNDTAIVASKTDKSGSLRYSLMNKDMLSVYVPVNIFPDRTWTIILTVPTATVLSGIGTRQGFAGLNILISISGLIILVLTLFSAIIISYILWGVFKPLAEIRAAADKIGQGDLDVEISPNLISAQDEFGQLARTVKGMATKLKELYSSLEMKVSGRTKDLSLRTEELEKANSLMVGRELRMIELKDENEKIKKELEERKRIISNK